LVVAVLVAVVQAGPIGITRYSGPAFPYSAGFFVHSLTYDDPSLSRVGTFVCSTSASNRLVDVVLGSETELKGWNGLETEPSAVDPTVFYAHAGHSSTGRIEVIRIAGDYTELLRTIPLRRPIGDTFTGFLGVKRHPNGSDVVYFYVSGIGMGAIFDGDGDGLADTVVDRDGNGVDDIVKFEGFKVIAVAGDGTGYGFEYERPGFPLPDRIFALTIWDTDGDLIPDTPAWLSDPRGRREIPGVLPSFYAGAVDDGTGRIVIGYRGFYGALEIDGDGFPVGQAPRLIPQGRDGGTGPDLSIRSYFRPAILHDGSVASQLLVTDRQSEADYHGVYVFDDRDFNGLAELFARDLGEAFPALTLQSFDPPEFAGLPSVHELTELRAFAGGHETITFADFGIWPDGRAFTFRQAGVDRTSVTVSLDGLLSFAGPVTAAPSLAALAANPGLVAPAWSDQWDTSRVRVFAGCAPVQRRFADGSGSAALSFAIEWRGLVSPNGKRTSLRCLLLEDGSFRVDYGAMETGEMPVVVGYSSDGPGELVTDDLSDNSWGGQPAGTLDESKLSEEFGAAAPFDLSHKWVRFSGYGELRGPRPELVDIVLKKGNRIQMNNAGSNIQPGATLVVDSTETFELAKSATGSKWTVKNKALSAPGAKSVESIWSDGAAHSVVVVNPDGGRSLATELR